MKKNDRFQFVVYRENYLTKEECIKLRDSYDTDELVDANLAGDYTENIVNKNVRKTLNIDFHDENLFKKLNDAIKVANKQYFNYEIESIDILRFLKYGIDSNYTWHTDIGRSETSLRKLTAIIQLSEENDYDGGEFLVAAKKFKTKKGSAIIFPANFMYPHKVMEITKGIRWSIVTWLM